MRLLNKLKSLPRTYYIIGVPLLCGIIIGTTITLSIPHVKAAATITNSVGSPDDTPIPIQGNSGDAVITNNQSSPTQPAQNSSTTPINEPTTAPIQQSSTTSQQSPTVVPCK